MALHVSDDLSLPLDAATWVISYLAKRGAGKTYNAADQAEEMLKAGIPIVALDGMGIWWGLRVSADGKSAGLPIVVFGGEHADLPLIPERAAEVARAIVESNISCVLDFSVFSKYAMRKFVTDFLNELYRLNRVERHVFIEESDMLAPQKPIGQDEAFCLSAVDNFVRRGGNHNLGCTLITQRSAVLNKNILTQSDCLIVLRTLAPQDKKAIQAWVEEQTDDDREKLKEWYDSLKELEDGEAWVWHPEKPAIFRKVQFRKRETFHATREFIKSPEANKIQLMPVGEFVDRFRKVFKESPEQASVHGGVHVDAQKVAKLEERVLAYEQQLEQDKGIIEEYESGRKIPECIQARLKFLVEVKVDFEKQIKTMETALHDYDDLRDILSRALRVENIYDQIHKAEERLAKNLPVALPSGGQLPTGLPNAQVGLEHSVTVVDVAAAEKLVVVSTENMRGKILAIAKKGKLETWRRLDDIVKAVQEERWNATPQEVNNALNDLEKQDLVAKKHTDRNYYCLAQGVKFKEA